MMVRVTFVRLFVYDPDSYDPDRMTVYFPADCSVQVCTVKALMQHASM